MTKDFETMQAAPILTLDPFAEEKATEVVVVE